MVTIEGINAAVASESLTHWPPAYRWGAAHGLLFGEDGHSTLTLARLEKALALVRPMLLQAGSGELPAEHPWPALVHRIVTEAIPPRHLANPDPENNGLRLSLLELADGPSSTSSHALALAQHFGASWPCDW